MLKLETWSNTGSDTLTRPGENRWPGDPWHGDTVPSPCVLTSLLVMIRLTYLFW